MKRWSVISILTLVSLLACSTDIALGQSQPNERDELPKGDLKIRFVPYSGPGYETIPVQVIAVKGEIMSDGRIRIKWPHLRRNSTQTVRTVMLTAYIYDESHPDSVLLRGPIIGLGFNPRNWRPQDADFKESPEEKDPRLRGREWLTEIAYRPLLSPLVKDGKLSGNYRLAVGVSKVVFDDGTVWEQDEPSGTKINK